MNRRGRTGWLVCTYMPHKLHPQGSEYQSRCTHTHTRSPQTCSFPLTCCLQYVQLLSPRMDACLSYDVPTATPPKRKRSRPPTVEPWREYLDRWNSIPTTPAVGMYMEVRDGTKWYTGCIKQVLSLSTPSLGQSVKSNMAARLKVLIHFYGWNSRSDRWVL